MTTESNELRTMRHMAWSRAKGELDSMLCTYWSGDGTYDEMKSEIDKFVKRVEDHGYQE